MRFTLVFVFIISLLPGSFAQLPNRPFYDQDQIVPADSGKWNLLLRGLGYTKNNEYFNPMIDGYTLFGIQVHPSITYTLSDNFRFDAGLYVRQDFGAEGFREVIPTFTLRGVYQGVDVIFGTLDGSLNHGLIEPLYDFENVMLDRIEQGNQFRFRGQRLDLDMWIDWEKMIYRNDPEQEEVYGGIRLTQQLRSGPAWESYFPFHFILYHKGGSIDANPNGIKTALNAATGLELNNGPGDFPGKWEGSFYYLYYRDFNYDGRLLYQDGNGYYLNIMRHFRHGIKMMLSYWHGNEFISLLGGKIYPSVSSNVKRPYTIDPSRDLLIFRLFQEIELKSGAVITARFEPMYDFSFRKFDFNHGLYFTFKNTQQISRRRK